MSILQHGQLCTDLAGRATGSPVTVESDQSRHRILGDLNRALLWYRNEPLSAFGYMTAEQFVREGRREDVLMYIASIEAGAIG